jgi:hypothetical protein
MLGITVPDAVLILGGGTALLTAYLGTQKGSSARREAANDIATPPIGGLLADAATLRDLVEVLKQLVVAINEGIESNEQRAKDRQTAMLEDLLKRLEDREALHPES